VDEWLEYTTNVTGGTYDVRARVASNNSNPGDLRIRLDGVTLCTLPVESTGGWQNWTTLTCEDEVLSGGNNKVLRLEMVNGGSFNVNWIEFASSAAPTDTPVPPTDTPVPPTATPGGGSYTEDFNDGQAQNWSLSNASVTSNRLQLSNWGGSSQAVYDGQTFSADYVYEVDLTTTASDDANKVRILFNYSNGSNYYYVEIGGSSSNSVTLKKVVGGSTSTLATYGSSYSIKNVWATFEVQYDSGGYITVTGTKSGTPTTLFNNVQDSSLTSGKIGVAGQWMVADADNVVVTY
jgi:hypothetical protein